MTSQPMLRDTKENALVNPAIISCAATGNTTSIDSSPAFSVADLSRQ